MSGGDGIVIELQMDCLNNSISESTILRKAKVIASKLDLIDLSSWISAELDGYTCHVANLPPYRKGLGQPKFFNPYNGWCPIMTDDGHFGTLIRTVFLNQPVSELEQLASGDPASRLTMTYNPVIQNEMQKSLPVRMECALHFSKAQVRSALDYVRNKILDWALSLEKSGIIGENLSFKDRDKREARAVTNHIYGSNIGVLGDVAGDATASKFVSSTGVQTVALADLLDQLESASGGLAPSTATAVRPILDDLRKQLEYPNPSIVTRLLESLKSVLEGASGNLVAAAMLSALGMSSS